MNGPGWNNRAKRRRVYRSIIRMLFPHAATRRLGYRYVSLSGSASLDGTAQFARAAAIRWSDGDFPTGMICLSSTVWVPFRPPSERPSSGTCSADLDHADNRPAATGNASTFDYAAVRVRPRTNRNHAEELFSGIAASKGSHLQRRCSARAWHCSIDPLASNLFVVFLV